MKGIYIFIFVLAIVALISIGDANPLPEDLQKRQCASWRSQKFTGACIAAYNGEACNNLCKTEKHGGKQGRSGSCHYDFPGFACFCYDC
ncbi:hypothetical protein C1645_760901 [Glomus cerebriforme]|uniref:Knottin scorpion toxin-like domain-containing protein n=1 Tax=Glomus cerebriforme TaxID=658196 RepID=A0A397TGU0_9GLOM|nr:hypothetical protein C1645_760901 [Glomus cerebriforme]